MEELTKISVCKKLYISERPNSIDEILCKALAGECKNIIIKDDALNYGLFQQIKLIIISSLSKHNYTKICRYCFENEIHFIQLGYHDFEEEGFDEKIIYKLTVYNLEIFRNKSIKAKFSFLIRNPFDQFMSNDYVNKYIDEEYNFSSIYLLSIFRIIVFRNSDSVKKLCSFKNKLDKSSIFNLYKILYNFNSVYEFCQELVNYYSEIRFTENEEKYYIHEILFSLYEYLDEKNVSKVNGGVIPLICYLSNNDEKGIKIPMLEKILDRLYSDSKHYHIIRIVIYAIIHQNDVYQKYFSNKIKQPKNKFESVYHDLMNQLESPSFFKKTHEFNRINIVEAADQYIMFHMYNVIPNNKLYLKVFNNSDIE